MLRHSFTPPAIVRVADFALVENRVDGGGVVQDVEPVAHVYHRWP